MTDPAVLLQDPGAPVHVQVQRYAVSRLLVLHGQGCTCDRRQALPRPVLYLTARDLPDLLRQVWPHEYDNDPCDRHTTRSLARRVVLGRCAPALPIDPTVRTLMRQEPPMPDIAVLVCPDATGKQIVHDPECDHPARLRAASERTGSFHLVDCLHALVPLVLPDWPGSVEDAAASEFEVRGCVGNLPTARPTPVPMATKLQVARKRAHSALVALWTTSLTIDGQRTREASARLEQRATATGYNRRAAASLTPTLLWEHLVAASECAVWNTVRQEATDGLADDASDQEEADRWVKAASRMRANMRGRIDAGLDQGGSDMGRAFAAAELGGWRRFLANADGALHEVDVLREQVADQAG